MRRVTGPSNVARSHLLNGRIFPPRDAWLARATQEAVLEPDLPIVDTHHRLWTRGGHRYLSEEFRQLETMALNKLRDTNRCAMLADFVDVA